MTAPTIGRTVGHVPVGTPGGEYDSVCRAAIVTEVEGPAPASGPGVRLSLAVLSPTGLFFNTNIPHSPDRHRPGTWHWPCVRTLS